MTRRGESNQPPAEDEFVPGWLSAGPPEQLHHDTGDDFTDPRDYFMPDEFNLDMSDESDSQLYVQSFGDREMAEGLDEMRKTAARFGRGELSFEEYKDRLHQIRGEIDRRQAEIDSRLRPPDETI